MNVAEISHELQCLQRQRAWHLKSRIMIANRLQATVAGTLGYSSGMTEKERAKKMVEASRLIKDIAAGKVEPEVTPIVKITLVAIHGFDHEVTCTGKAMEALAKQLPVAAWVEQPEQRGFGLLMLAIVIGETGDLANYANPGKVWRRMGCAPFTKDGETLMGATWRSRKNGKVKLNAEEWANAGYPPRRRSIAYLIGEGLLKLNGGNGNGDAVAETENHGAGPYRLRYDVKKAEAAEKHPEWIRCSKCDGTGKQGRKKCTNCKGTGEVWMHCHLHGMLLMTKLLLKELWCEWNGRPAIDHLKPNGAVPAVLE